MQSHRRRAALGLLAGAAGLASGLARAQSAAWPSRPLKIVVPNAPGGTSDIIARLISKPLQDALGVPVVVDNRSGASGNLGAQAVAQATDGHTLLLADVGSLAIAPVIFDNLGYSPERDLKGVTLLASAPHLLVVSPGVPAATLAELVALSKKTPVSVAIPGGGTPNHLATVQIAQTTGLQWTPVPYRGGAPAVADTAAGATQAVLNGMPATLPLVQAGRLKAIGVSRATRSPLLPQVPTLAEQGLKGFESGTWQGLMAPASMPREHLDKLNALVVGLIRSPALRAPLVQAGLEVQTRTPAETDAHISRERERWRAVVRAAGGAIAGTS
ncbi:Bug family tripartite tricarboxylate transporter substrate binding protein [Pseudaquabacterium rugosum]|uniref:Tripartite tricarboxylate transporter substrate-binding protein n=1 Tax=Pseudaquabacterium rugosum TaxID=2984194 RepID=A0ABU9BDB1_9BURK